MPTDTSTILWSTAAINAVAVICAPFAAVWVQRQLDAGNAATERKRNIFRALWANRKRPYHLARIDALNMIDIEFFENKAVRNAWRNLFAHFRDDHPGISDQQQGQQREALYVALLSEMSKIVGYELGTAEITDNNYIPALHARLEETEIETRNRILDLLKSDALPVKFVANVPAEEGALGRDQEP